MLCVCTGAVIRPQGFFQCALFWVMPLVQPLLIVVLAALAAYTIAFAGVAALHFQPYIAPLLVGIPPSVADCRQVQAYMKLSLHHSVSCLLSQLLQTPFATAVCSVHARLVRHAGTRCHTAGPEHAWQGIVH